jgi:hypothetical protein
MPGARYHAEDQYQGYNVPYPYRAQPSSLRMEEEVCPLDDDGKIGQYMNGTAYASTHRAVPYNDQLPSTGMLMACNNSSPNGSTVFGATGEADMVDHGISQDGDRHEVAQYQDVPIWTPKSKHYSWNNQAVAAGPWAPLTTLYRQLRPFQGHNNLLIINSEISTDAWSPSGNSQEDYWASQGSTAVTSQPSSDARYYDMMDNPSTLRPPLIKDGRSWSAQRPSNRAIDSSRSHPYSRASSYTASVVDEHGRPQQAMSLG